ncbi:hypothetical protein PybrP1_005665 [[Pythium] brassicae (nom. inval.)]|nr:hypothetical protein PybrP1_005665 [[Pythium] brassicae (nom. inval.)]
MLLALTTLLLAGATASVGGEFASFSPEQVHTLLNDLYARGDMVALEKTARRVLDENPDVATDTRFTTPFEFLGIAQYALGDLEKALEAFEAAVRVNPEDAHSWVQLGTAYLYLLRVPSAAAAFEVAVTELGARYETHSLFKVRNWMADWRDREPMLDEIRAFVDADVRAAAALGLNALDFIELPGPALVSLSRLAPVAAIADPAARRPLCCAADDAATRLQSPQLRIGFVSSDFGVHPVSALLRGLLQFLAGPDHPATVVYCFSLTDQPSWWRRNISRTVDHMVSLAGRNAAEGAAIIRAHNVHVLVDLNGHTLHSGLPLFAFRPSPVQIAFLGYPMTTGSAAIDFVVSDAVATPAEASSSLFTEKLLLLPTHYIVNDHMQLLGHTVEGEQPALVPDDGPPAGGATGVFVFATFSNWQKIDPSIFRAWMSILARVPNSVLWFLRFPGHEDATRNLRQEAKALGVDGDTRLVFSKMVPWIQHTHAKRAADLVLDTALKNGHTTMLDALMAGVPVVTLEGSRMSTRAGSSALASLDLRALVVNSYKEYEDVAVHLAAHPALLRRARAQFEANRLQFPLFDTRKYAHNFEAAIKSVWAVKALSRSAATANASRPAPAVAAFHIFPAQRWQQLTPRTFPVLSGMGDTRADDEYATKVGVARAINDDILLHVGGHAAKDGWWIVDADTMRRDHVDFHLRMDNLHPFPDGSVAALYASHVLEHGHYQLHSEVERTLREWRRVLKPGGELFVSVPDLLAVSTLFANATAADDERMFLMRVLYGGQLNAYDVHKVGFFSPLLEDWLAKTDFCDVERVADFGLFQDASTMLFKGVPISLNVKARACVRASEQH